MSAPKRSVDDGYSSSDDHDQEAIDYTENDVCSEVSDGSADQPYGQEAVELDKHLLKTFIAYETAMSPTGKVDQEQVEACKKLVGKALHYTDGGLEYKDYGGCFKSEIDNQREVSWSLLSRAMGFAAGRIPCIPWPIYNQTDPRCIPMRYALEMRCPYQKWYTAQSHKF